jgi:hypothetical protein
MAETKRDATGRDASTQPVVDLLTNILKEVQKQVQSKTPKPLEGPALQAVNQFREIVAALALQPPPNPTIALTASPDFVHPGEKTTLTWSSTNAQKVSIDQGVGDVTPAEGGSQEVTLLQTTTFTATAAGPCGTSAKSPSVTVNVD